MFEFSSSKEQVIIKRNTIFMSIGLVLIIVAIVGVRLLFGLLPFEENYTFEDIFDLLFVCVWVVAVFSIGFFGFITNSKRLVINNDGILCKSIFNKSFIKWTDVKDWGLSYCGETRGEGSTYYLYFSQHKCEIKMITRKN